MDGIVDRTPRIDDRERISGTVAFIVRLDGEQPKVRYPVRPPRFSIGKSPSNDLCIPEDNTVSRHHCGIRVDGARLTLEDLGSRNGTYLDGVRISKPTPFGADSMVTVGKTRLLIVSPANADESTTTLETMYTTKGSILIPATTAFQERTQGYLVVDVVGSTRVLERDGEVFLGKIVATFGRILDKKIELENQSFLQCTGDGFLASFSNANTALEAAEELVAGVQTYFPSRIQISIALHWGPSRFRPEGGLIGKHIHAVFALQDLRNNFEEVGGPLANADRRALIVLSGEFLQRLGPEARAKAAALGKFPLKGMEEDQAVFLWEI